MSKKTLAILGATCKLGVELSFIYARNNYDLILISRNLNKINDLKKSLEQKFPDISIKIYELDILDLDNQKSVINEIKGITSKIFVI